MQRTIAGAAMPASSPSSQRASWLVVMPAAIEITSGRLAADCDASASQTARITCGFGASSQIAAPSTAMALSSNTATPKSRASASRSSGTGSATRIADAGVPREIRPPIRLRAMLPPPMKAIVLGVTTGGGCVMGGNEAWGKWAWTNYPS
jgi:hypothetical protein